MNQFKLAQSDNVYEEESLIPDDRPIAKIGISAYRGEEDEPWRHVRLLRVANRLVTMAPSVAACVTRLHDHKGDLFVEYHRRSNEENNLMALQFLTYLWEEENEYNVGHVDELFYDKGKPYLALPFVY